MPTSALPVDETTATNAKTPDMPVRLLTVARPSALP